MAYTENGTLRRFKQAGKSCVQLQSGGMPTQGVYVITTQDDWPCKIGVTANLYERIAGLQIGNWHKLRAVDFWFVFGGGYQADNPARQSAVNFERHLHEVLGSLVERLSGEWFDLSADDARRAILKIAEQENLRLVSAGDVLSFDQSKIMRRDDAAAMHDLHAAATMAYAAISAAQA